MKSIGLKCMCVILVSYISVLTLSSCKQKNNDNLLKKNSISGISGAVNSIVNYDNLKVDTAFKMPEIDKLYTFSIYNKIVHNENEDAEVNIKAKKELCTLVKNYSGKKINEEEIEFEVTHDNTNSYVDFYYNDSDSDLAYTYSTNGSFVIADTSIYNDVHNGECLSYAFIKDGKDVVLDKEITGFSACDALNLCNKKVVSKIVSLIPEDELIPHSIASYKFEDGTYSYCIIYAKKIKGLTLSEAGEYAYVDDGFIKPTFVCVQINDKKGINSIINFYPNEYIESSFTEIDGDSFISIDDAISLLSKYLAPELQYSVQSIDLTYFLPTKLKKDSSELIYTKYIPGYEIVLDSKKSTISNLFPRKTAYIDIVTGDVYITDSIDMIKFIYLD